MAWLLSRNIADWNPRDVPNTKMKQELIEASMPNPQRFILEYIDTYWPENAETIREIPCAKFYGIYATWCQDNGEQKILSNNKFGMEIKQFATKIRPRSEGRTYHYKLDRKMIMEKFNDSLGNIPSSPFQLEKIEESEPDPPKPNHFKIESDTEKPSISMDNLLGELQDYIEELKATSSKPYGILGPSNTSVQEIISHQEGKSNKVE